MLNYNTQQEPIPMPEYGRHIQQMVDHCLTIEDRDERNACARTILHTICNLFPSQKSNPEWRQKLWDHLAMMSGFKLDIDYPVELIEPESLHARPERIPLPQHESKFRQYGHNVEQMIATAVGMNQEDPDREEFILLIANHMKKLMLSVNPEAATDERVFKDLAQLSGGQIVLNADDTQLREYIEMPNPNAGKKKRRRK